jgi:NTP pyrophosphatase (non-canonical NTP hydrolase)
VDSLNDTIAAIVEFRDERDWAQFHTPRHLAAALAVEGAELQETMLWKSDQEIAELLGSLSGRTDVSREIADVLILALLFCHAVGVDPLASIRSKLEENARKYPPELAKGSATKYSELRPRPGKP